MNLIETIQSQVEDLKQLIEKQEDLERSYQMTLNAKPNNNDRKRL